MRRRRQIPQAPVFTFAPMVDIVLLLLIFFMTTTTFLQSERSLRVDLPTAKAGATTGTPLEVIVSKTGQIAFGAQTDLTPAALETAIRTALSSSSSGTVSLRADRGALHGRVVAVMDAIKRAGATRLSVAVQER